MDIATLATKLEEDLCFAAPELHREKIVRRLNQAAGVAAAPLEEQITAWKEASGLIVGGDPDGVRPEHLMGLLLTQADIATRAKRLLDSMDSLDAANCNEVENDSYGDVQRERQALRDALAALPEDG